jgi:hypothetical protein
LTFGGFCSASRCICIKLYASCPEGRLYEKRRIVAEFLIKLSWLQGVQQDFAAAAAVQVHTDS